MAPDDRFADAWRDIPDPVAPSSASASRSGEPPRVPSPTRGAMKVRRAVALAALVAWPVAVLLRWEIRPELAERASFVAGQAVLFVALLVAAGLVAISAGRRGLGGPVSRARIAAVGAPIAFMLVGLSWLPPGSPGSFGDVGPGAAILPCVSLGLLVVTPILLVALWALGRAFPSAAGWRGAALGVAVGLVGSLVLTIHCSSPFGGHVALAHGLPIVIAGLVGGLLGSKVARA
jgi:hypothetical protein